MSKVGCLNTISLTLFPAKNVAADIAQKLCDSVAVKLEGKVLGTFSSEYLSDLYMAFLCYSLRIQ